MPRHRGLRTLFAHSERDEYVPKTVDAAALGQRFVRAAGGEGNGAASLVVRGGSHNLKEAESAAQFVAAAGALLAACAEDEVGEPAPGGAAPAPKKQKS